MINRHTLTERNIKYNCPVLYSIWLDSPYYPLSTDTIDIVFDKLILLCELHSLQMPHKSDVVTKSLDRLEEELIGKLMKEFDRVEHKDGKVIIYFKTGKLTGQFLEFPDSQLSDVVSELNKINALLV